MLCEVKVFLCLIKHVKKDKVRLGNKAKLEEKKKPWLLRGFESVA